MPIPFQVTSLLSTLAHNARNARECRRSHRKYSSRHPQSNLGRAPRKDRWANVEHYTVNNHKHQKQHVRSEYEVVDNINFNIAAVKLEYLNPTASVKDRAASAMIENAEKQVLILACLVCIHSMCQWARQILGKLCDRLLILESVVQLKIVCKSMWVDFRASSPPERPSLWRQRLAIWG